MRDSLDGRKNPPRPELVEGRTALIPAINRDNADDDRWRRSHRRAFLDDRRAGRRRAAKESTQPRDFRMAVGSSSDRNGNHADRSTGCEDAPVARMRRVTAGRPYFPLRTNM